MLCELKSTTEKCCLIFFNFLPHFFRHILSFIKEKKMLMMKTFTLNFGSFYLFFGGAGHFKLSKTCQEKDFLNFWKKWDEIIQKAHIAVFTVFLN